MSDFSSKQQSSGGRPGARAVGKAAVRQRAARCSFFAAIELTDVKSGAGLKARTSDLSTTGCYVDTLNPFALGAEVHLRITHSRKTFEALGQIASAQVAMGMGVAFTKVAPDQRAILDQWLAEMSSPRTPAVPAPAPAASKTAVSIERRVLHNLIRIMIKKGYLEEDESAALLSELHAKAD